MDNTSQTTVDSLQNNANKIEGKQKVNIVIFLILPIIFFICFVINLVAFIMKTEKLKKEKKDLKQNKIPYMSIGGHGISVLLLVWFFSQIFIIITERNEYMSFKDIFSIFVKLFIAPFYLFYSVFKN